MADRTLLRVGHKGADALAPGNTLASFAAAVDVGVDVIELDVVRPRGDFDDAGGWKRADGGPGRASGPLLVAHDWGDAARREPLTLAECLDAFGRPPLNRVQIDLDLKIAGREDEVVAALRERGLTHRAMVSGMELPGLRWLAANAPDLRLGWTLPRFTRDWRKQRGVALIAPAWRAYMHWRLPEIARREAPRLGAWAVWVYEPLVDSRLIRAAHGAGISVIAWTVDDLARMRALAALGVDGICTNDPRLFARLG